MHFATHTVADVERDGAVWCIDYVRAHELLPERIRRLLADEGADVFTTELLAGGAATLGELEALDDELFLLFVEPPSFDARIVNQYALFSVLSRADARLDDWIAGHPELAHRVVVPAELKWEVRDKLDQANVTERVLFPGLDGISRWARPLLQTPPAQRVSVTFCSPTGLSTSSPRSCASRIAIT